MRGQPYLAIDHNEHCSVTRGTRLPEAETTSIGSHLFVVLLLLIEVVVVVDDDYLKMG